MSVARRRADRSGDGDAMRTKIIAAMVTIAAERGYADTDIDAIVDVAKVDRADFFRYFDDLETCFYMYFQAQAQEFMERMLAAYGKHERWRDGIREAAYDLCDFALEDPDRTKIMLVNVNIAGDRSQGLRDVTIEAMTELIYLGRNELEAPDTAPRSIASALAGAIHEIMVSRVQAGEIACAPELIPDLLYMVLRPYIGEDGAREAMNRATASRAHPQVPSSH